MNKFLKSLMNYNFSNFKKNNAKKTDSIKRINKLKSLGVQIGTDCEIYSMSICGDPTRVRIGSHVEITSHVVIISLCPYHYLCDDFVDDGRCNGDVSIGDNSFIGIGAILNPGSSIGNDCIIGAGAVVSKRIGDGLVAFGNPIQIMMNSSDYLKNKIKSYWRLDTKNITNHYEVERLIRQHFGIK